MTMTSPSTELPYARDSVGIDALHLRITEKWKNGSAHNIHLLDNGDLGVILKRGHDPRLFPALEDQAPAHSRGPVRAELS